MEYGRNFGISGLKMMMKSGLGKVLSLPNAYKLMCFDRNINGNRDDKFFDCDYWSLH